ncbi:kinase-like domain-containing protein [Zopfochytrium polystomum]|nr:kinase-like domain-containing protein [Zopfochytrium polystomum]
MSRSHRSKVRSLCLKHFRLDNIGFLSDQTFQSQLSEAEQFARALGSSNITSVGNYAIGKTVGEGSFGKVKLGIHKLTGQEVAIKVVDKMHAPSVVREIETWRYLHHPNIAQLYEVLTTESKIYMVTEYCPGGEAFDYICSQGRLDDRAAETRRIFRQVVDAVGYCHTKNFVHRDLKLENILLTEELQVKVIDFGFTRQYNEKKLLDTYCGSSAYAAPGKKYSGPEADIWSLGVILYTLVCGYLPFDDENDIVVHKKITDLDYEFPSFLNPLTIDLISRILVLNASERVSINDILSHPWFRDDDDPTAELPSTSLRGPLGSTPEEAHVVSHLEALGMDVSGILSSVHAHACDQASALWYLLLQKYKAPSSGDSISQGPSPSNLSNPSPSRSRERAATSPVSLEATSPSPTFIDQYPPTPTSTPSPPPTTMPLNAVKQLVPMEQYLANARRRKSMPGDVGSFSTTTSARAVQQMAIGRTASPLPPSVMPPALTVRLRGDVAAGGTVIAHVGPSVSPGNESFPGSRTGSPSRYSPAHVSPVSPTGVSGGRRAVMMEAMRSANASPSEDSTAPTQRGSLLGDSSFTSTRRGASVLVKFGRRAAGGGAPAPSPTAAVNYNSFSEVVRRPSYVADDAAAASRRDDASPGEPLLPPLPPSPSSGDALSTPSSSPPSSLVPKGFGKARSSGSMGRLNLSTSRSIIEESEGEEESSFSSLARGRSGAAGGGGGSAAESSSRESSAGSSAGGVKAASLFGGGYRSRPGSGKVSRSVLGRSSPLDRNADNA